MSKLTIFELFLCVGNLKPKHKWFFKLKLKLTNFLLNCHPAPPAAVSRAAARGSAGPPGRTSGDSSVRKRKIGFCRAMPSLFLSDLRCALGGDFGKNYAAANDSPGAATGT